MAKKARNIVIAGYLEKGKVSTSFGIASISRFFTNVTLDKKRVADVQIEDKDSHRSVVSGFIRGSVGAMIDPVGAIVGATHGKKRDIYTLRITFLDGNVSIVEVDHKTYECIIKTAFR